MIVGFNIESIDGSRENAGQGKLQVQYNPKITSVEKASVGAIDGDVAKIDFSFEVNYVTGSAKAASINLEGHLLWNGDTEQLLETWENEQSLPENVNAPLMNDLYRKCLSQAVGIADTLNLIPPIPTPTVEN
ncbi:hypothetical protein [Candidatus Nanohalococcus occultus]|uniref:hypothetical protein n=1 Tax=Candidatus Nanohalococcus occultus TaxID=2978047 RepID=UPI0039E0DEBF